MMTPPAFLAQSSVPISSSAPFQFCPRRSLSSSSSFSSSSTSTTTPLCPPSYYTSQSPPSRCRRRRRHRTPLACRPRPDADKTEPAFLPQTIEYALRQSQHATRSALCADVTHIRVELPMGRSRAHWYTMSPPASWYDEASILVFHYAQLFRGLHITIVLGSGPGVTHPVPWISELTRLEDDPVFSSMSSNLQQQHHNGAENENTNGSEPSSSHSKISPDTGRVVIFAGVTESQHDLLEKRIAQYDAHNNENNNISAVILFCSFLQSPVTKKFPNFELVYLCRAYDKVALLRDGYLAPWSVFIEIAVFEFEWIGNREVTEKWIPLQETLERFVFSNGAFQKKTTAFLGTNYSGCEAGFWPFMTICSRNVLPLDGHTLEREAQLKRDRSKSRPFGFF